ncbi:MAG: orotate phosphoribosyltransferase [Candidatus Hydrogenedens sp.]|nr:orotate phosphoribosyltransferase [Candidatus Hydrogenedens sp.]
MDTQQVLALFEQTGALLNGHFIYASGRHGSRFLQASRVLQFPEQTEALCKAMAESFQDAGIQLVVGPATGGIILSYETARHLGCRAAFTEKEPDGTMALKRGFRLEPGTRVLVVEDIITTGGSVKKSIDHLRARGADIVAVAALIDRSGGQAEFDVPFHPLATLTLETYDAESLPPTLAAIPVSEPDDLVL